MKSVIKICDMSNTKDVANIQKAITSNEGIMACEISISKKEAIIVYNEKYVTEEKIIDSIEDLGYVVI